MKWLRGDTRVGAAMAEDTRTGLLLEDVRGWEEHEEGNHLRFVFYLPPSELSEERARSVENRLAPGLRETADQDEHAGAIAWSWVDDEDWAHAWKRFWKPQRIGRRLVVKPTWEPYPVQEGDVVVELDPGMAFGTGTHATTWMCMEWLETVVNGGERVLDVGTGSGILSISALLLGASSAVAVDNDPIAVRTASENAALNGVGDRMQIAASDLVEALDATDRFDIIVANIVADAIIALAPRLAPHRAPHAPFVASGIIVERVEDVRAALEAAGMRQQEWRTEGEWASVCSRQRGVPL